MSSTNSSMVGHSEGQGSNVSLKDETHLQAYDEVSTEVSTNTSPEEDEDHIQEDDLNVFNDSTRSDNTESTERNSNDSTQSMDTTMFWIPTVPESIRPKEKQVYPCLAEALDMYYKYAECAGFEVRKSTEKKINGITKIKYLVCSKFGKPQSRVIDTLIDDMVPKKNRVSKFKVTDCKAGVRFQIVPGTSTYLLNTFNEAHNHCLLTKEDMVLSKKNRELQFSDQQFVVNAATTNFGPSIAHRIQVSMKGGHENVGSTEVDYKNFWRDVNAYIGNKDAQMLVNMLEGRRLHSIDFSYEHRLENRQLSRLFWADGLSKANYAEFGDVISMDATYRTNKYAMIFVPITGVNNHKKSFIVGAALLEGETIDAYKWMLEAFLRVHKKQPQIVLTDQDPSLIQAIPSVFKESNHRLCMWHIMSKLNNKVSSRVQGSKDFKHELHKLVWNCYLSVEQFEERWKSLIEEFDLSKNKWLSNLYEIRTKWIPAYFRHIPLCGLMKTTSRSESSNSYFNTYSRSENNFVSFMVCFDTALDKQRCIQRRLDFDSKNTTPKFNTSLEIERHASQVYTRAAFLDIQKEILKGEKKCLQWTVQRLDGCQEFVIIQKKKSKIRLEFKVVYTFEPEGFLCSCFRYQYHGIICRHIFRLLINLDINKLPENLICRRWTNELILSELLYSRHHQFSEMSQETQTVSKSAYNDFNHIMQMVINNLEKLKIFANNLHDLRLAVDNDKELQPHTSKKSDVIKNVLGVSQPESVDIIGPTGIKNKGCGTGKRLKGIGEKIVETMEKRKRQCHGCGELGHDKRNCTNKGIEEG